MSEHQESNASTRVAEDRFGRTRAAVKAWDSLRQAMSDAVCEANDERSLWRVFAFRRLCLLHVKTAFALDADGAIPRSMAFAIHPDDPLFRVWL